MTTVDSDALFADIPDFPSSSSSSEASDEESPSKTSEADLSDAPSDQDEHSELPEAAAPRIGFTRRVEPRRLRPHVFQRIVKDMDVTFGDCGEASLKYPVYACPALSGVDSDCLARITENMSRLADIRNDVQQNGVVEDIVDPELYPLLIHGPRGKIPRQERKSTIPVTLMKSQHRGSYVWLPSRVRKGGDGSYRFASPINNLPRTASNSQLYTDLETLLTSVMPALIECGAAERADGGYNVVVKLQRYNIPAGVAYSGQWHTEGVTEGVSAAGVVYVDLPAELTGGALKFRPVALPQTHYRDYVTRSWYQERVRPALALAIGGQTGSSVVFSNTLPHRFETLENRTDATLTRSFVNFFVTDPLLKTTNEVPTNADIYLALCGQLNYDVIGEVLSWLHLTPMSRAAAVDLRAMAKAEMVANKGRWGLVNYGNCGLAEYIAGTYPCGNDEDGDWVHVQSHYTTNSSAPSLPEC